MDLFNTTCCSIYNDHLLKHDKHIIYWSFITQLITVFTITTYTHTHFLQPKNNHIVYRDLSIHLDTVFTIIYAYTHFLNQQIRIYDVCICNKGIERLIPQPSSNTKIHLFPRKSRIHFHNQTASNFQHYNPVPLVLSMNNYQLIILGCNPNVDLIPYGNSHD